MIILTINKSRIYKKGKSIFITIPELSDVEDEELLGTQLSSLPKIIERGYRVYSVPCGYAIADPFDDQDGWYVEVPNWIEVEHEAMFLIEFLDGVQ